MRTKADLSVLLRDNPVSHYWAGLIAADGSMVENRLKLQLADKPHQKKFAQFIGANNKAITISAQDPLVVPDIRKKYDFRPKKTYNPPRIRLESNSLTVAFIIGFIDGDGSIGFQYGRTDCILRVKNHQSWLPVLMNFHSVVCQLSGFHSPEPKINSDGYAAWAISNNVILKWLKQQAISLQLPVLQRKWKRIDLQRVSLAEQARINEVRVTELQKKGYGCIDIAEAMSLTKGGVSRIMKRMKERE